METSNSNNERLNRLVEQLRQQENIAKDILDESDFKLWNDYRKATDDELSPYLLLPIKESDNTKRYLLGTKTSANELPKDQLQLLVEAAKERPWDIYEVNNTPNCQIFLSSYGVELRCIKQSNDNKNNSIENERGNWMHFQSLNTWDEEEYIELVETYPEAQIPKQVVYMWVRGMQQLVEAVDVGALELTDPPIIEGITNERHAEFLSQWGFAITDLGEENNESSRYNVSIDYTKLKNNLEKSYETELLQQLI